MSGNSRKKAGFETGRVARERLRNLLLSDRLDFGANVMEMLRLDVANAVSNYMEIEERAVEIQINQTMTGGENYPVLSASIPIRRVKKLA
jgi:cell division topological specificity factor